MSGCGGCDDESAHAIILAENEIERIRLLKAIQSQRPSRSYCLDCDNEIPLKRQQLIQGVQYCVNCAVDHEHVPKIRMLAHIL